MEKELEALTSLIRRIRQECKALDDNAASAREGKVSDDYLSGHFSYVENLFQEYSTIVQETALQDDRLEAIKREADQIYRHVCALRSSEELPTDEQEVLRSDEEQGLHDTSQQEKQLSEDDGALEDSKQQRRTVRKPQALSETAQKKQQLQREKAASLGMNPAPGRIVTEDQIRDLKIDDQQEQEKREALDEEKLNRNNAQLQEYREKQQQLSQQKSIGNSHIDMSRDIWGRKSPNQQDASTEGLPLVEATPEKRNGGYTKADTEVAKAVGGFPQRYKSSSISRTENLFYAAFSQTAQRLVAKVENDAVQAGLKEAYYLKTAYSAARIPLSRKPAASIKKSSQQIIGKELIARRNDLIRQNRDLKSKISTLEHRLQNSSYQKKPAQIGQAEQLKAQITALRSQLPGLQKQLKEQDWIRTFQHQRTLDQQLVTDLSVTKNHRIPSGSRELQELSRTILKKREEKIRSLYEAWNGMPTNRIPVRIKQLTDRGTYLKKQLRLLQDKNRLTAQERSKLMKLKQQLMDNGKQIAALKGLLREREDLAYVQEKLSRVLRNAGKQRQRQVGTAYFMRNLILQPIQAGTESNTEWLSKSVSFTTNPRTIRYAKKAMSGTAYAAGRAFQKAAPTVDNWIRYQVSQKKNAVKNTVKSLERGIRNAIPSGVKTAAHTATAPIRGVQKIGTGIHNRVYAAKQQLAGTRLGMRLQKQRQLVQSGGRAIKKGLFALKAIALKAVLIFAAVFLIVGIIASAAGMIAGSASSTMILSPQVDSNGKINLAPYVQIVKAEISAFNGKVDSLRKTYENDPDYDNVEVRYSGTSNNMREVLSMMAVRMQQNLDTGSNADVARYIKYLVNSSHTYGVSKHHYFCSGCEYRPCIPPESNESDDKQNTEPEMELYCPGHTDVTITVAVCTMDEMMAQDDYPTDDDWPGWNDENTAWCKTIYEMDWAELYTGLGIGHGVTIGTIVSAADEAHIWQTLMRMTGNPYGVAGLMGNLYAESGLSSINLQNSYEDLLGYDDIGYTHAVDSGSYQNFSDDRAGYGLAQWTAPSRKNSLYRFAKSQGVSIGHLDMQLEFLHKELSDKSVLSALQNALSVREASDEVLVNFEQPADQSERAKSARAALGEYFYNKYQMGVESEGRLTQKQIDVIRVATNSELYGIPAEKGMCQAWAALVYGAAGLEVDGSCCAYHSGMAYGVSDDWSAVPPGAAVYGYAGNKYGHVGIYVGNGLVYHNVGGVAVDSLYDWVRIYDGFAWGWQAGQDLTIP